MSFIDQLKNIETELNGTWLKVDDKYIQDDNCIRIESLVTNHLKKIATDESGWDTLFQDPNDNRFWVLTYPNSNWHGGGPPTLKTITLADAQTKFSISK